MRVAASAERVWVEIPQMSAAEAQEMMDRFDMLTVDGKSLAPNVYWDEAWSDSEWREYTKAWECADAMRDHIRFLEGHYANWQERARKSIPPKISQIMLAMMMSDAYGAAGL